MRTGGTLSERVDRDDATAGGDASEQRIAIGAMAGRLVVAVTDIDGGAVPAGPELDTVEGLTEFTSTLARSLAHRAAVQAALTEGRQVPEPADDVAVGAQLDALLAAAKAAAGAAVGGASPDDRMEAVVGELPDGVLAQIARRGDQLVIAVSRASSDHDAPESNALKGDGG